MGTVCSQGGPLCCHAETIRSYHDEKDKERLGRREICTSLSCADLLSVRSQNCLEIHPIRKGKTSNTSTNLFDVHVTVHRDKFL